jgi:hypothetical protein
LSLSALEKLELEHDKTENWPGLSTTISCFRASEKASFLAIRASKKSKSGSVGAGDT